jgi:hypothetical protein
MSELSPRNEFTYPSDRELPFYDSYKAGFLAQDSAIWANAENTNLVFTGGGFFSWDATTNTLLWTDQIGVHGFTTPFKAVIDGAADMEVFDGEVIFFKLPRVLEEDTTVQLYRSNRTFLSGAKLHDIKVFCARVGSTIYFGNGQSLKDGDTGDVFGQGLLPKDTEIPHAHETEWVLDAPPGLSSFTPLPVIIPPELGRLILYRNGQRMTEGPTADYTLDTVTGEVTLNIPTGPTERLLVDRRVRDLAVTITSHDHSSLFVEPPLGTTELDAGLTAPILISVRLFRGGYRQAPGSEYTIDLTTGKITLVIASAAGERFEIERIQAV